MSSSRPATGAVLPAELTTFVNRRREVEVVTRSMDQSRLVTIVGEGGVGKTRLAQKVVRPRTRRFPDGLWWCDLASVVEPDHLVDAIAASMRMDATGEAELIDLLRDWSAMLVLDNCEHLADACARLAAAMLRACPQVRVLATSRQPLEVPGESVFRLAPLPVQGHAGDVRTSDAVTLFIDRAERLVPEFDPSSQLELLGQICTELDGLPLAIELAVSWLPVIGPRAILARLEQPLELLSRPGSLEPVRHRSLSASVAYSHALCTPDEQALWRHLTPFVGGAAIDAVEFVGDRLGLTAPQTLAALNGLVRKSVLNRTAADGEDRYSMLVALRAFGFTTFDAEADRRRAYDWLVDFYLDFFQRAAADWWSPRQAQWLARFAQELPNVRQALEFALGDGGRYADVYGLTLPSWRGFWATGGRLDELRRWLARALEHPEGDVVVRLIAGMLHAYALGVVRGPEAAQPYLTDLRAHGERIESQRMLIVIETVEASIGSDARAEIAPSEAYLRMLDDQTPTQRSLNGIPVRLAILYDRFGFAEKARPLIDEIIATSQATGERYEHAYLKCGLGANALARGDVVSAIEQSRESLRLRAEIPPDPYTAHAVETIAAAVLQQGDAGYAALLTGVADGIWRTHGHEPATFPCELASGAAIQAAARAALGDADFERNHAAGLAEPAGWRLALAEQKRKPAPARQRPSTALSGLTPREREVAGLVAEGLSDGQIADRLVLSVRTAQGHVQRALVKLGLTSRTQLAAWVIRQRQAP